MKNKKLAILLATASVAALGTGAAIGAGSPDEAKQAENEILADAAERLDTTPDALRDALGAAVDAQLDQAVEDGRLTQEQADEIRRHRQESGRVLGIGGHHGPGHPGGPPPFGKRGGPLAGVADALGIPHGQLIRRLRRGSTLAEIARAEGRSVAEVKAAALEAAEKRLDAAVADDDITSAQAEEMLERLGAHIDELAEEGLPDGPPPGRRGGHRGPSPFHP